MSLNSRRARRVLCRKAALCVALAVVAGASPAERLLAQTDETTGAELTILAVLGDPDRARGTDDAVGLHVSYGRPWTGRWHWEATYWHLILDTGADAGTDFYQTSAGLEFAYRLDERRGLTPLVFIGAGFTENDVYPDNLDEVSPYLSAGAGLLSKSFGRSGVRIRGRITFQYDDFNPGFNDRRIEVGVTLPLGRRAVEVRERIVYRDVVVESAPEVVHLPPPDTDSDGIVDSADECPDSLADALVDATGCVRTAQAVALRGVNFEFGSARLTVSAERILADVYRSLAGQPSMRIEIAGHTDSVGSDRANLALSQARAEAVRTFLTGLGLDGERASARGYGESEPVTSEVSDADRAMNRRVEFRIEEVR